MISSFRTVPLFSQTRFRPSHACRALCFLFSAFFSLSLGMAAEEVATPNDYGPMFYGVELPADGANVLLIIDTSKSMGRKDAARTDGGTRWDTLVDEVTDMTTRMREIVAARRVHYAVSLLYEGGDTPHPGSGPYLLARPADAERLLAELRGKTFTSGGSFETTFGETLWPLVSKQHITHIFYLGDNDIGRYAADPVRASINGWYGLPPKNPTAAQRPLHRLKTQWWAPWKHWRRPTANRPVFKSQQSLPPPPRPDVILSAIAIGQASPLLEEIARTGHGEYVERLSKKSKRRRD